MEEMKQSVVQAMELRLKSRDQQILHLKQLLSAAIRDRDEAQRNYKKALFEKLLLQHQLKHSRQSSDDPNSAISSIVSAPEFPLEMKRPLPEKGRLLQAVKNAGPLLETLLLAGPLPQWRHPPPPVDPYQILPPPQIDGKYLSGRISRKRVAGDGFDRNRTEEWKHQRRLRLQ